jgi:hypothetical protein
MKLRLENILMGTEGVRKLYPLVVRLVHARSVALCPNSLHAASMLQAAEANFALVDLHAAVGFGFFFLNKQRYINIKDHGTTLHGS